MDQKNRLDKDLSCDFFDALAITQQRVILLFIFLFFKVIFTNIIYIDF